jgi:hypothetical protein
MRSIRVLALLALLLWLPRPSAAQAPPRPDQQDLTIDAATRRAVVDTLCDRIDRYYVFPDRARTASKAVQKRMAKHEYDRITSASEFADSLTVALQEAVHDLHLRVHYRYDPIPEDFDAEAPPESELRRMREANRLRNYGFERAERLQGNVGYLDLRMFSGDPDGQAVAVAAMNFLASSDALIVDLRRNGGGSPAMIATLLTYFVAPDDRLLFNTFYERDGDRTVQYYTSPYVPGPRRTGKPLYVVTSRRTGSAAEEFAYDVQTHKLGTIVGEPTAGGANPGGLYRLNDHFAAFIATGRAINPVTNTNWEGVGVQPDSLRKAGEAVRDAYVMALERLLVAASDDPDRAEDLKQAIQDAEKRPVDPDEDFVRPTRRRAAH